MSLPVWAGVSRGSAHAVCIFFFWAWKCNSSHCFCFFFQPKALGQTLLSEVFFRGNLIESDYFGLEFQNMQMNWVCKASYVYFFHFKTCLCFHLCQNSQLHDTIMSVVSDCSSASLARTHTHTDSCTSIFVKTFIDKIHYLAT